MRKYWLLARMCNDVIVHASQSGFFLYLSPECKAVRAHAAPPKAGFKPPQKLALSPSTLAAL